MWPMVRRVFLNPAPDSFAADANVRGFRSSVRIPRWRRKDRAALTSAGNGCAAIVYCIAGPEGGAEAPKAGALGGGPCGFGDMS